ncbi:MAG TPA: ABC transporter substrate-binding protein [Candidatus Limnocylindria bacterium]|nr:ABC transporter substrate-binding protein [Candidatus Limnocylindria bacterium]
MRRTRWNAMAFLFSGALVLAACGQQGATPTPEGTPTGTGPAETGAAGDAPSGQIRMIVDGQITTLGNAAGDVPTAEASQFYFNALYQYNESLEPIPDLAEEECEISEDALTYTCTLREGVLFHNGEELTADDVAFTYQIAQSENCRFNPSLCLAPFLENVEAVDDRTVEFTLIEPYAPFNTVILPGIYADNRALIEQQYDEFAGAAEGVDPAEAQAGLDALAEATGAEEPDPAACEEALAPVEGVLETAQVALPDRNAYQTEDGQFDPCAYGGALTPLVESLIASLEAEGIDAIAAAYPLLPFNQEPMGTGPWMCEPGCFSPGESLTATAFEDYFDGPPATAEIVMPIITDETAGVTALQSGEVDWKYSLTGDSFQAIQDDENLKFAEYPDFGYYALQFNLRPDRLFADVNLRKAVQLCVDKARTTEVATNGQGIPVEGDIPPASWAYVELPTVERNVDEAKALIEESGWTLGEDDVYAKDGQRLSTKVYVRAGRPDRISFMQLTADQVAECGIEFEVVEADFATVLVPMLSFPHIAPGDQQPFDAYFGGWSTGYDPDPFSLWHSSQCTSEENPDLFNYICFQNEEADALIEEGLAATSQEERAEIYAQFEEIIYEEQPYFFAWSDIAREGLNANLESTEGELNLETPQWHWQLDRLRVQE